MTRIVAVLAAIAARPFRAMAQQDTSAKGDTAAKMELFNIGELFARQSQSTRPWLPFLKSPALHCGVYVLAAGAEDTQQPHNEDEVYYVESGRAKIRVEGDDREVAPGSIIYVKARAEHFFHTIEEELRLLVFFSTAQV